MDYNEIGLKKKPEENERQYIWRLGQEYVDSGKVKWPDQIFIDIINKELELEEDKFRCESAYRKPYQVAKGFYEDVFSKLENDEYYQKLKIQREELEIEKIQLRDERNEINRLNRNTARVTQKLDYLEKELKDIGKRHFKNTVHPTVDSDNDLLVILSDLHIGQCFESNFGSFNSDIAQERLNKYLLEIIKIATIHKSEKCYISLQGDLISNSIHKTLAITNRENVISQIKIATEMIVNFCRELSKVFTKVFVVSVAGNHSRIDRKEDSLHDERLDDLICWSSKQILHDVDNIIFLSRNIDNGISDLNIRGKTYIGVHGDFDPYSKNGVANLSLMLGFIPYAITFGHLHTCGLDENHGIKMIRGGSLAGSGDSYTIEKRLSGKPSQMVCVCNTNGIYAAYPIEL